MASPLKASSHHGHEIAKPSRAPPSPADPRELALKIVALENSVSQLRHDLEAKVGEISQLRTDFDRKLRQMESEFDKRLKALEQTGRTNDPPPSPAEREKQEAPIFYG